MSTPKLNDLQAFLQVARDQSFTKAATRLGVTPSALSHTMRGLEERMGLRLLARTTRNVAPTEAGERLMRSIGPLLDQIAAEVEVLGELRDKPAGTIRITCSDDAAEGIIRPMLAGFLAQYPDIQIEICIDYGFTNIVSERFDAGIRLGESISKDMIAVRLGPDSTHLHQHPPLAKRQLLRLGVREGQPQAQHTGQRAIHVEQHDPRPQRRTGRRGPGLRAGLHGRAAHRQRPFERSAGRLEPVFRRLSLVLPEPATSVAGVQRVC